MSDHGNTRREFLRRGAFVAVAAGAAPALLTSCYRTSADVDPLERARNRGFMNVGFANEAPYGYAEIDGTLTGESPELAREILAELGVPKIQGVLTPFDGLVPGLKAGRFDLVAAGMFITPERCQEAIFSDPDYCAKTAFLVRKGNPHDIQRFEDVAEGGLKLGVLDGAVEPDYATQLGVGRDQLVSFGDAPSAIAGLETDRCAAFSLTSITLRYQLERHQGGDIELTEPYIPVIDGEEQTGCGGFAFRKKDTGFRDTFNAELHKLEQSGRLLEIIEPFGFSEEDLTDERASNLCRAA